MSNPMSSLGKQFRRPFRETRRCVANPGQYKGVVEDQTDLISIQSSDHIERSIGNYGFDLDIHHDQDDNTGSFSDLLDDLTSSIASANIAKYSSTLNKANKYEGNVCQPLSKDYEIISKLMERIKALELSNRCHEKELKDKNLRIKVLEDKCNLYKAAHDVNDVKYSQLKDMTNKCIKLENKISEMEGFLADYGLIWVGDKSTSDILHSEEKYPPDNLISSRNFVVDYDKIFRNIDELNLLVKSEETQITITSSQRAELKKQEAMCITFYSNGIFLFNGPFRPFSEDSTRQFIHDIQDGYFPSELECKYPLGIPINATDRRNIMYDIKPINAFKGIGRTLGGESTISKLTWQKNSKTENERYNQPYNEILTSDSNTKMTMEQFLSKLPQQTITKDGKILAIRNSIKEIFEDKKVTQNIAPMKCDNVPGLDESMTSRKDVAQIKIRSVTGDKIYHIVLNATDLVDDLYRKLYQLYNIDRDNYVLVLSFPTRKVLSDFSQNIKDCGLIPTASLHVEAKS